MWHTERDYKVRKPGTIRDLPVRDYMPQFTNKPTSEDISVSPDMSGYTQGLNFFQQKRFNKAFKSRIFLSQWRDYERRETYYKRICGDEAPIILAKQLGLIQTEKEIYLMDWVNGIRHGE